MCISLFNKLFYAITGKLNQILLTGVFWSLFKKSPVFQKVGVKNPTLNFIFTKTEKS